MAKKQIIAIGGGGYPKDPNFILEKYILQQTQKTNPKIFFLPQASYESRDYITSLYKTYCTLGAQPGIIVWCRAPKLARAASFF